MKTVEFVAMIAKGVSGTAVMEISEQADVVDCEAVLSDINLIGASVWLTEILKLADASVEDGQVLKITGSAEFCDIDIKYTFAKVEVA